MKKFTPEESPCIAIFYFICLEMAWFLPIDNIMEKDIFVFHNTTTLLHKRHVLQIHTHTHTHTRIFYHSLRNGSFLVVGT
mmetsp:Transcript_18657/g.40587  ORF Transcript_18657/g.40587 Transcript_18657/m.40587 type:complete len:80 (+) Transcript_18657:151-390(+)